MNNLNVDTRNKLLHCVCRTFSITFDILGAFYYYSPNRLQLIKVCNLVRNEVFVYKLGKDQLNNKMEIQIINEGHRKIANETKIQQKTCRTT